MLAFFCTRLISLYRVTLLLLFVFRPNHKLPIVTVNMISSFASENKGITLWSFYSSLLGPCRDSHASENLLEKERTAQTVVASNDTPCEHPSQPPTDISAQPGQTPCELGYR